MEPVYDILVLGDYFYDLIYSGLPQFPELGREVFCEGVTTTGGAMYITAVSMRRLGVNVGWPAYWGNDYYSQSVYQFALAEGLDMRLAKQADHPYRRVTTAMPLHGERAFVTFADEDAPDLYDFWLESARNCQFKHLHIGGLEELVKVKPIVELARARGATISADCQDGPHLDAPCDCRDDLALIDIFMPNKREALVVAETETLEDALEVLAPLVKLVVVKDGSDGVWVAHEGQVIHQPSISAGTVIDTTGAGDCFNAGFLYGLIVEGAPLDVCARYGNICGGLSVTGVGGATAAPTKAELDGWMGRG